VPLVAVVADCQPVMRAWRLVVREPVGPPTRAPGLRGLEGLVGEREGAYTSWSIGGELVHCWILEV
jgi:hypothetical protein